MAPPVGVGGYCCFCGTPGCPGRCYVQSIYLHLCVQSIGDIPDMRKDPVDRKQWKNERAGRAQRGMVVCQQALQVAGELQMREMREGMGWVPAAYAEGAHPEDVDPLEDSVAYDHTHNLLFSRVQGVRRQIISVCPYQS